MNRTIRVTNDLEGFNSWVKRSIRIFNDSPYLDNIRAIYPFQVDERRGLEQNVRRQIIRAHSTRETQRLFGLLKSQIKFPYDDPVWYILKNIRGCMNRNPNQVQRIAEILHSMTAEEVVSRLEAPPKLNTQIGQMFRAWLSDRFNFLSTDEFQASEDGIFMLAGSEEEGKSFVTDVLGQNVAKRPDLICKANRQVIIGEAKWIGQPGGNQTKQVVEVLDFCRNQRGHIRRVGIVDGFPWAIYNAQGNIINKKEAVMIQESEYDLLSALLLEEYLNQF